ncbi:MAG: type II secretion system protein GspL [Sphingobium sp.]
MSAPDALIVALPEEADAQPSWMRVVDGTVVRTGAGTGWLAACGLDALPQTTRVMLVPPAALTVLHWIRHPELPARQGRAAARLAVLADAIGPGDSLIAATDRNDDPAQPHIVAVVARADMAHWLGWAHHHGIDPDIIVPAPLLLPAPREGFNRAVVGGTAVLRGVDVALPADIATPELIGEAAIVDISPARVEAIALAALDAPPFDLRQGDFVKRVRRNWNERAIARIAVWSAAILLVSLLIALIGVVRQHIAAGRIDADSLAMARQVLPQATDVAQAEADMDRQLAARGIGGHGFAGPVAGLMRAMQGAPGVSLTALARDADGTIRATLASVKGEDINIVLLALQAAGFTITATSAQDPSGRTLADITVRA